jgi:hypothetical protein
MISLLKEAKKLAAEVVLVKDHVDESTRAMREQACRSGCPHFGEKYKECLQCGCMLDVKWKAKTHRNPKAAGRTEVTHCPLGKWNDVEIANIYLLIDGQKLIKNDQETL